MTGPGDIPALTAESTAAIQALGPVHVAVAVHALDQARHVARVLDAAATGLAKTFAGQRAAVLVADGGSGDDTRETVRGWARAAGAVPGCAVEFQERVERGRATLGLLAAARATGAAACGLIDADLVGLSPEWIERLLSPVTSGEADFVSPAYTRSAAEGTLTTNVLAPLARALYGRRIQQLAGGCAALSGPLLGRCLDGAAPPRERSASAVEIWLTTEALATDQRVVEVHLGRKPMDPDATQPDVATTLVRTVGPLLVQMERHRGAWQDVRGSTAVLLAGDAPSIVPGPGGTPRVERMVRAFQLGLKDLLPVWEQIMPEATLAQLYPLGLLDDEAFRLPPALWARVVVDFAVAHHECRLPHDHLLRALTPLYLGRVAAFLLESRGRADAVGPMLETIGRAFEAEKDALVARWR